MTGFCRRTCISVSRRRIDKTNARAFCDSVSTETLEKRKAAALRWAVPLSKNFYFSFSALRKATRWPLSRPGSHRFLHVDLRHPHRVFWVNQLVYNRPINKEYIFFRVEPSFIKSNNSLLRLAYSKSIFNADIDQDVLSRHSSDFFNIQKGSPDR